MPDKKKKEKKGLIILLLIILLYVSVVVGIAIYVKLDKAGYFGYQSEAATVTTVATQPKSAASIEIYDEVPPYNLAAEEESLDTYEQNIGRTIADIPAKPRPEEPADKTIYSTTNTNDVLSVSDLHLEVEEPIGIWESIQISISDFFYGIADFFSDLFGVDADLVDDGVVKLTPEKAEMLMEINGELAQMQSHFMSYTEESGLIWIDHVDKPNPYEENGFYMYMGLTPSGHVYHRTVIRYSGKEWIGLKNILLQTNVSDRALIIDASENNQTNEIKEIGAINEWVDLAPTQENNDLLNTVVSSDNVKITFMGDLKNIEWILSEEEMMTLRESMYYYNLLKEKEELLK